MKNIKIYDIESYYNFFCLGIKDYETKQNGLWEISEEKNDIDAINNYFSKFNGFLISVNGIHYDNIVLKTLLKDYNYLKDKDYLFICGHLKKISDCIINDDYESIKEYKWYKTGWTDIDLFCYWSKMLRISKKISLKSLAVQLNYPVIQELPFPPDIYLKKEDLPKLRHYNLVHDLGITELLYEKMKPSVNQRTDAIIKFGFGNEIYSWDGVKLGLNILLKEYCNENNISQRSIQDLRTPFPNKGIQIKDIILPSIKFNETPVNYRVTVENKKQIINCNSFYSLFEHLKTRTVHSTTELNYSVLYKGVKYDIKSGGLHSWHENDLVRPDLTKFIMRDKDVSSYYPTLGSEYSFVPVHLPGMGKLIKKLKTLRLKYKSEGNKKDAELYKLALNGGYYGNLNNEYSPMYDPLQLLSVTINGQLFLLMLCEWLTNEDIIIDACNTDGVTSIIPIDKIDLFEELCSKWENITKMELEAFDYKEVIRKNINNYIAVTTTGEIKRKGLFKYLDKEIPLGDSTDELVIAKALNAYYIDNIKPSEFISNPDKYNLHIYDFCKSNKIEKKFSVTHNGQKQQQLNRYYFSKSAPYLYKQKLGGNIEHVNVGEGVELFNTYVEKEWKDYKINYSHYIKKTEKIIDSLNNNNQMTLF